MKVLIVNSVCGIGSTGRIVADLYHTVKEQGHDCKIAYGRETATKILPKDTIRIGGKWGVYTHAILSRITDKSGFYSTLATKNFIKKIKAYNPDIIHLHNIHGYYINVEVLFHYLAKADKPVIWTLHDCWPFTGHCAYYSMKNCYNWKTQCQHCPQKHNYPASYIFDNSKDNFNRKKTLFTNVKKMTFVTPSRWLTNEVKQSFLSQFDVVVISNHIDYSVFKSTNSDFRERNGFKNKRIVLGVASEWDQRKGFQDFIELSTILDERFQIVLVGLNKKQMKQINSKIYGLPKTKNAQELAAIYTAADVFVNPTHEDNYPTVNLESLACGTPVITYQTGGSPETLTYGYGIVVHENRPEAIANVIMHMDWNQISDQFKKSEQIAQTTHETDTDYITIYKQQLKL